jgi:hypothetical protein
MKNSFKSNTKNLFILGISPFLILLVPIIFTLIIILSPVDLNTDKTKEVEKVEVIKEVIIRDTVYLETKVIKYKNDTLVKPKKRSNSIQINDSL